jgi:hypothetical protein
MVSQFSKVINGMFKLTAVRSLGQTTKSYSAFSYISVTYHSIKGPYITTYGNPSGPQPVH